MNATGARRAGGWWLAALVSVLPCAWASADPPAPSTVPQPSGANASAPSPADGSIPPAAVQPLRGRGRGGRRAGRASAAARDKSSAGKGASRMVDPVAAAAPVQVPPKVAVVEHRVVLRDGTSVPAKDLPRLSGKAVVFTDAQSHLVSLRVGEVDLKATGAANHIVLDPAASPPQH